MIDSCTKVFGNEEQNKIDEIKGKESENLEVNNKKTEDELLAELSKEYGEAADYLEKNRKYRAEEDVFSILF